MHDEHEFHTILNRCLGLWPERNYSLLNSHHCCARDVLQLFHACLDRPFAPIDTSPFKVLGAIAQARTCISSNRSLSQYLLLLDSYEDFQIQLDTNINPSDSAPSERRP